MKFLSERNLEMHREYLNELTLKYRIFEKSYKELCGADLAGILKAKISAKEREEAARLYAQVLAHRIFFSSFGERNQKSERIKKEYGSVSGFLFDIFSKASSAESGFLFIYEDRGRVVSSVEAELVGILKRKRVLLALDLFEHAYFYDYGFKKEDYIMNAVAYLDLSKIDND